MFIFLCISKFWVGSWLCFLGRSLHHSFRWYIWLWFVFKWCWRGGRSCWVVVVFWLYSRSGCRRGVRGFYLGGLLWGVCGRGGRVDVVVVWGFRRGRSRDCGGMLIRWGRFVSWFAGAIVILRGRLWFLSGFLERSQLLCDNYNSLLFFLNYQLLIQIVLVCEALQEWLFLNQFLL